MANAVKVDVAKFLAVAAELGMFVNKRGSDAKVYKAGTSGSSPCVQLLFGGKSALVSGMDVVNCLVSPGKPHRNVQKESWYGTVQQEIGWSDEAEALRKFRDACLDIKEGKAVMLKKGGKGDYAPDHKRDEKTGEVVVAQPAPQAAEPAPVEEEQDEPLEQAAAVQ